MLICWDGIIWDPWGLTETSTSNTQRFGYLWKFGRSPKIYPSPKEFMSLCNNMGYPVAGLLAATKTPWILRGFFRVLWRLGQDFHAKHLWSVKSVSSYSPCSPKWSTADRRCGNHWAAGEPGKCRSSCGGCRHRGSPDGRWPACC